jgi:predicted transcriptional regulator
MNCNHLFKCLFNIKENEINIYKNLLKKSMKVDDLVIILHKDRSTIQRSLLKLVSCGLVKRKREMLKKGGGHYYVYSGIESKELKKWLNKCVDKWHDDMNNAIKKIDEFILSYN